MADAINVLMFVHGIPTDPTSVNYEKLNYQPFYDSICAIKGGIRQAIPYETNVAKIEWGHDEPDVPVTLPDQELTAAENFILSRTGMEEVKKLVHSDNTFLPFGLSAAERKIGEWPLKPIKDKLFTLGMTDVLYYTSPDGELAVRRHVYNQFFQCLEAFRSKETVQVHIISHSQGASISFDFLFGVFASPAAYGTDINGQQIQPGFIADKQFYPGDDVNFNYWRDRGQKGSLVLGSFSSFGSQLALNMMRKQRTVDLLFQQTLLDPTVINVPKRGDTPKWKHFYDPLDILGYPVRHLFDSNGTIKEYEVASSYNPIDAHSDYWFCKEVQQEIATLIDQNLG